MSKQNKDLILISYDFPPSTGGIARLCHEIVNHLQDYYKSIQVVTISKDGLAVPYQDIDKIKITYLPKKRGIAELKALKILRKWPDKQNTDVICGIWHPDAMLALFAGFKNVFTLAHGTELLSGQSKFRKYIWLPLYASFVLNNSKGVLANSKYTAELVKKISCKAKVNTIPLGVNPSFFRPLNVAKNNEKLKICTVSRVLQFKGHDFILEALCDLPKVYRERIEWHIAGTGPFLKKLKTLSSWSPLNKQVFFHGFVPDSKLPTFYNKHDLFVLATRATDKSTQVEGFGLVFLEAQACGLPVIGTQTGGIPDAIKVNQGGFLIEQDNVQSFQNIVIDLLENPLKRKKAGLQARARIEQEANWTTYIAKLKKVLFT